MRDLLARKFIYIGCICYNRMKSWVKFYVRLQIRPDPSGIEDCNQLLSLARMFWILYE